MVLLAQGHFLLAYIYQFRAGKINQAYAKRYIPFAVLMFASCFLLPVGNVFEILATTYFLIHFFYDERYLLGEKTDLSGWLICLPTIALLGAEILYLFCNIRSRWLFFGSTAISALTMFVIIFTEVLQRRSISKRSAYFLTVFIVSMLLVLGGKILPGPLNVNAVNFLILLHFGNWYWHYFNKFASNRQLFTKFFTEIFAMNALMATLMYFHFHSSFSVFLSGLAGALFLHPFFHIWTLLHFVATFRPTDIGNWYLPGAGSFTPEYGGSRRS